MKTELLVRIYNSVITNGYGRTILKQYLLAIPKKGMISIACEKRRYGIQLLEVYSRYKKVSVPMLQLSFQLTILLSCN